MSTTSIFIDPLNGTDAAGKGAIGDPYKSTQYALDNVTGVSSWPVQFNIKSGAPDVLGASLDISTFSSNNATLSSTRQMVFSGYDNTENDGGKGVLDGDGTYSIIYSTTQQFIHFIDIDMGNCGSNVIYRLYYYSHLIRCVCHGSSAKSAVRNAAYSLIDNCHFYDIGNSSNDTDNYGVFGYHVYNCYLENLVSQNYTSRGFYAGYECNHNIFITDVPSASYGYYTHTNGVLMNNVVLALVPSGSIAIYMSGTTGTACNNIIVGYSNGGTAFYNVSPDYTPVVKSNAIYNCTNLSYYTRSVDQHDLDNEILDSDPFVRSGPMTFENRLNYFEPLDVGNVWGGSIPRGCRRDKGAVQHKDNVYVVF